MTQITFRSAAIRVGVIGPEHEPGDIEAELALREVAERVRDDLLQLKSISTATIMGGRPYQIDVEIPESRYVVTVLRLNPLRLRFVRETSKSQAVNLNRKVKEVLLRAKKTRAASVNRSRSCPSSLKLVVER